MSDILSQRDPRSNSGPFRADQLRDGDRYELSDGHPLYCAPAGPEHATGNLRGAAVLGSDPEVEWAGIDAHFWRLNPRPQACSRQGRELCLRARTGTRQSESWLRFFRP
jgi:hypothetical protein